jgi:hypothetical protein
VGVIIWPRLGMACGAEGAITVMFRTAVVLPPKVVAVTV